MTTIRLEVRKDALGGTVPVYGYVTANRTRVHRDGALIVYPGTITIGLNGATSFELDPPASDEAVVLRLFPTGQLPEVRTVRFTGPAVDWADLVDVDPATLVESVEPPVAAWTAVLDELRARITPTVAMSQAAYNAMPTPDPGTLYLITS